VIQIINHESGGKMIPIVRVPSKTAFDHMVSFTVQFCYRVESRCSRRPGMVSRCWGWGNNCSAYRDRRRGRGCCFRMSFPVRASFHRNLFCINYSWTDRLGTGHIRLFHLLAPYL
jgi:hypothetical protein